MGLLSNILGSGGIGGKIIDAVQKYIPSKADKANIERAINEQAHKIELDLLTSEHEFIKEHNNRIKTLEGTSKELSQFGLIGKLVIFLRGLQRPLWGYAVMYMDIQLYSKHWEMPQDEEMKSAFWIINFLVLGFLFGERAVKNIIPLVSAYMGKKK